MCYKWHNLKILTQKWTNIVIQYETVDINCRTDSKLQWKGSRMNTGCVSLFGINLKSPSWSPNFICFSLPLYLVISLCTRLNSHMRGNEEIAEVDQRGERERRRGRMGGWSGRELRAENKLQYVHRKLSAAIYFMLHHPSSFAQCHLCSSFLQNHFSLFWNSFLSPLTHFLFPTSFSSSLFIHLILFLAHFLSASTSQSLFPPSFHSSSLCSLIILRSHAVKPFNGSVGVLKVWWKLPLSKCPAEYHSLL